MILVNWKPVDFGCPPRASLKPLPWRPPTCCLDSMGKHKERPMMAKKPTPNTITSPLMQRKFREARQRLQRKIKMAAGDTGRIHVSVQCARGPSETHTRSQGVQAAAQTDLSPGYFTKPPVVIIKCKTGLDAYTQVTFGDLLDFDTEVAPLAKALAEAVLQDSAGTVMYEDDAAVFRRVRAAYEAKRRAECVEQDRLNRVEAGRRRCGLRALEAAERAAPEPTFRAVYARAMAVHHMAGLRADALGQLQAAGYLTADDQLAAWMQDRFRNHRLRRGHRAVRLDKIISDVIFNRPKTYRRLEKRHPRFKDAPPEVILPEVTFSDAILSNETTSGRLDDDDDDDDIDDNV
ncbi:uncharacterized protein LOC132936518 [Metopolophium dirhodum]|uniref:uncharacterized protein LOC132936518 n=1 Tax=Metopolophium dirhodum TaxID=44670 RepID=UPI00298F7D13|nr:uncharacterized protein LOC132936518 [Metopolophium dirhodum]